MPNLKKKCVLSKLKLSEYKKWGIHRHPMAVNLAENVAVYQIRQMSGGNNLNI